MYNTHDEALTELKHNRYLKINRGVIFMSEHFAYYSKQIQNAIVYLCNEWDYTTKKVQGRYVTIKVREHTDGDFICEIFNMSSGEVLIKKRSPFWIMTQMFKNNIAADRAKGVEWFEA